MSETRPGGTSDHAYTREQMDTARTGPASGSSRFDGLHADAKGAVGYAANTLRSVRERYREAYLEELGRWHESRDELERVGRERPAFDDRPSADAAALGEGAALAVHDAVAAETRAA